MKCKLVGRRAVKYTSKNTGELVEGTSLYVLDVAETKNDPDMVGRRCAEVWTRLDVSRIAPGTEVELVYEQVLGSDRTRLVGVVPVGTVDAEALADINKLFPQEGAKAAPVAEAKK